MKRKKIVITLAILILFILQNITIADTSNNDFTIDLRNNNINLKIGGYATDIVYINATSISNENVSLITEWIGEQPDNVSVGISKRYGNIPFSSTLEFTNSGSEIGNHEYKITATGNNYTISDTIQVNIIPNNTIKVNTDKLSYNKGETIQIYGNLSNLSTKPANNTVFSGNVEVTLKQNNWKRFFSTPLSNNSYNTSYNISYGDPKGTWNVTCKITDNTGTSITNYRKINVSLPPDIIIYKSVWYSPSESAIYQRGATFNVSVFVTEDGTGVKNLTTNCFLPTLDKINLTEIKQGYYRGQYKIPYDSRTGIWVITFEGSKYSEGSLKAGGANNSIEIQASKINLEIIEPSSDKYYLGDTIEVKTSLKYSDGTDVEDAEVIAEILDETYTLQEQGNGIYTTDYKISNENTGSFLLELHSEDQHGNSGSATKVVHIIKKQESEFPLYTIITIIIVSIIGILFFSLFKKRLHLIRMQDTQEEIQELKRLQDEAAKKYYREGSISRQSYDILRKEHAERLSELQGGKKSKDQKNIISRFRRDKNE